MNNFFRRAIACLLVTCLLVDPVLASGLQASRMPSVRPSPALSVAFNQQALEPALDAGFEGENRTFDVKRSVQVVHLRNRQFHQQQNAVERLLPHFALPWGMRGIRDGKEAKRRLNTPAPKRVRGSVYTFAGIEQEIREWTISKLIQDDTSPTVEPTEIAPGATGKMIVSDVLEQMPKPDRIHLESRLRQKAQLVAFERAVQGARINPIPSKIAENMGNKKGRKGGFKKGLIPKHELQIDLFPPDVLAKLEFHYDPKSSSYSMELEADHLVHLRGNAASESAEEARQKLEAAKADQENARQHVDQARAAVTVAERNLSDAQSRLTQAQSDLSDAQSRETFAEDELRAADREVAAASAKLAALKGSIGLDPSKSLSYIPEQDIHDALNQSIENGLVAAFDLTRHDYFAGTPAQQAHALLAGIVDHTPHAEATLKTNLEQSDLTDKPLNLLLSIVLDTLKSAAHDSRMAASLRTYRYVAILANNPSFLNGLILDHTGRQSKSLRPYGIPTIYLHADMIHFVSTHSEFHDDFRFLLEHADLHHRLERAKAQGIDLPDHVEIDGHPFSSWEEYIAVQILWTHYRAYRAQVAANVASSNLRTSRPRTKVRIMTLDELKKETSGDSELGEMLRDILGGQAPQELGSSSSFELPEVDLSSLEQETSAKGEVPHTNSDTLMKPKAFQAIAEKAGVSLSLPEAIALRSLFVAAVLPSIETQLQEGSSNSEQVLKNAGDQIWLSLENHEQVPLDSFTKKNLEEFRAKHPASEDETTLTPLFQSLLAAIWEAHYQTYADATAKRSGGARADSRPSDGSARHRFVPKRFVNGAALDDAYGQTRRDVAAMMGERVRYTDAGTPVSQKLPAPEQDDFTRIILEQSAAVVAKNDADARGIRDATLRHEVMAGLPMHPASFDLQSYLDGAEIEVRETAQVVARTRAELTDALALMDNPDPMLRNEVDFAGHIQAATRAYRQALKAHLVAVNYRDNLYLLVEPDLMRKWQTAHQDLERLERGALRAHSDVTQAVQERNPLLLNEVDHALYQETLRSTYRSIIRKITRTQTTVRLLRDDIIRSAGEFLNRPVQEDVLATASRSTRGGGGQAMGQQPRMILLPYSRLKSQPGSGAGSLFPYWNFYTKWLAGFAEYRLALYAVTHFFAPGSLDGPHAFAVAAITALAVVLAHAFSYNLYRRFRPERFEALGLGQSKMANSVALTALSLGVVTFLYMFLGRTEVTLGAALVQIGLHYYMNRRFVKTIPPMEKPRRFRLGVLHAMKGLGLLGIAIPLLLMPFYNLFTGQVRLSDWGLLDVIAGGWVGLFALGMAVVGVIWVVMAYHIRGERIAKGVSQLDPKWQEYFDMEEWKNFFPPDMRKSLRDTSHYPVVREIDRSMEQFLLFAHLAEHDNPLILLNAQSSLELLSRWVDAHQEQIPYQLLHTANGRTALREFLFDLPPDKRLQEIQQLIKHVFSHPDITDVRPAGEAAGRSTTKLPRTGILNAAQRIAVRVWRFVRSPFSFEKHIQLHVLARSEEHETEGDVVHYQLELNDALREVLEGVMRSPLSDTPPGYHLTVTLTTLKDSTNPVLIGLTLSGPGTTDLWPVLGFKRVRLISYPTDTEPETPLIVGLTLSRLSPQPRIPADDVAGTSDAGGLKESIAYLRAIPPDARLGSLDAVAVTGHLEKVLNPGVVLPTLKESLRSSGMKPLELLLFVVPDSTWAFFRDFLIEENMVARSVFFPSDTPTASGWFGKRLETILGISALQAIITFLPKIETGILLVSLLASLGVDYRYFDFAHKSFVTNVILTPLFTYAESTLILGLILHWKVYAHQAGDWISKRADFSTQMRATWNFMKVNWPLAIALSGQAFTLQIAPWTMSHFGSLASYILMTLSGLYWLGGGFGAERNHSIFNLWAVQRFQTPLASSRLVRLLNAALMAVMAFPRRKREPPPEDQPDRNPPLDDPDHDPDETPDIPDWVPKIPPPSRTPPQPQPRPGIWVNPDLLRSA